MLLLNLNLPISNFHILIMDVERLKLAMDCYVLEYCQSTVSLGWTWRKMTRIMAGLDLT